MEIAKAFLNEHKRISGIADAENDLKLEKRNVPKEGGKSFLFVQRFKGIPVLNSGIYFYVLDTRKFKEKKKMFLVK